MGEFGVCTVPRLTLRASLSRFVADRAVRLLLFLSLAVILLSSLRVARREDFPLLGKGEDRGTMLSCFLCVLFFRSSLRNVLRRLRWMSHQLEFAC